jgi:hypothetical protein
MRVSRIATCLALAAVTMLLVPAVGSARPNAENEVSAAYTKKERRAERRQNARITSLNRRLATTRRALAAVRTAQGTQGTELTSLRTLAEGTDARLRVIEGAAPQILQGLTDLKAGLEKAGAGLESLKALATSTEYGIGQVIVLTPTPQAQAGSFVETPDIPDAVQQAQTTQQFVAQHTGNLGVLYGVRSAESDGTGASDPAALCKVTVTNEGGTTETTAANPGLGGLPFQPVPTKSKQTSTAAANQGFPFGLKTSGDDADQTVTFASSVAVTAGDTYTVGLSCVDTSASADDPTE